MFFLTQNFLLQNETARTLYHEYAAAKPIIDYHNHLSPADIACNRNFENLTKIWLDGDHYKWRAMRTMGVDESYITGSASDKEKFRKWAATVPYTVRNPLYHWTHMELKNYFGIEKLLGPDTADEIYEECSEKLASPEFSTRALLEKMGVEVLCTTDDPVDSLEHHQEIRDEDYAIQVLPAFRPDQAYGFGDVKLYNDYVDRLEEASSQKIGTLDELLAALESRIDFFHGHGGRISDHGIKKLYSEEITPSEAGKMFEKVRGGKELSEEEIRGLQYVILLELGKMYSDRKWIQQYHLGPLRNTNDRMMRMLGRDAGFDSIGDYPQAEDLARFLNRLDAENRLAKTILYNVNPSDNAVLATMIGNFNDGSIKGKMQFGSAWWYLDQKDGIEAQMNVLSAMGLISCFIGMVTDSRSFLSFPRHEYFRRILCNLFGRDVENGELPRDMEWVGKIVSDICYHNAKEYFDFSPKRP
jgi:glucuronate isomerase